MLSVALPVLVRVTCCAGEVLSTYVVKLRLVGERLTVGACALARLVESSATQQPSKIVRLFKWARLAKGLGSKGHLNSRYMITKLNVLSVQISFAAQSELAGWTPLSGAIHLPMGVFESSLQLPLLCAHWPQFGYGG